MFVVHVSTVYMLCVSVYLCLHVYVCNIYMYAITHMGIYIYIYMCIFICVWMCDAV